MNCKIQSTMDTFEASTIPDVFKNFTKKLEKESQIEDYFVKAMDLLK